MTRSAALLALAGALIGSPLAAQDLDEVLHGYYEAVGGLDAWKAVQSRRATGTMTMGPEMEAAFTVVVKRPHKMRIEFTFQGMTGVQAYDGETAWMIMPFAGSTEPRLIPEAMAKDLKQQSDLDGDLIGYEESGYQVELVGKEATNGAEAYKLKITLDSGDVIHWYLDAESFLPIKLSGTSYFQGRPTEFETYLSDYRDVDGLRIPHSVETRVPGTPGAQVIRLEQVEVNVDVEDVLFVMPAKERQ